jgi:hypothetical protein
MVGHDGVSSMWSKVIGLATLDRSNRIISGLAAQYRAEEVARGLAAGKRAPGLLIDAKRLGLDVEAVVRQGGRLTPRQTSDAMLSGAVNTQFLADALSLPLNSRSGWGRVLYLYKSFALNQGRFVKDILRDARMGGYYAPLLRYAVAMGTVGVVYGELMRLLRGKPAPDSPVWRVIEDMLSIGGIGVFADMLQSIGRDPQAVYSFFTGPIIGEAVGTLVDVGKVVQGNPRPIQRRLLRRTVKRAPIIGQKLYDKMKPVAPKKPSNTPAPNPFAPSTGGASPFAPVGLGGSL